MPSRSAFRPAAVAACLLITAVLSAQARRTVTPRPAFAEPSIAPDGSEIAFVSGGDIWTVPAAGGQARLLISHAANDTHPVYSPDKSQLAFVSTRTGGGDVYVLTLASGDVRRVTFDDGLEQLDGWSRDGKFLYFFSSAHDLAGAMNDIYRVPAGGGTPMPVSGDRYANEFFSAASPDGRTLAISARGIASGQWWRHGHSHIDESEIWLRDLTGGDTAGAWRPITNGGAKKLWPMWSGDGRTVLYVPIAVARRTSGRPRLRPERAPRSRSHASPTAVCSGRRRRRGATSSCSSATSRSGSST
jgi:Tol biopolymer transport system component